MLNFEYIVVEDDSWMSDVPEPNGVSLGGTVGVVGGANDVGGRQTEPIACDGVKTSKAVDGKFVFRPTSGGSGSRGIDAPVGSGKAYSPTDNFVFVRPTDLPRKSSFKVSSVPSVKAGNCFSFSFLFWIYCSFTRV